MKKFIGKPHEKNDGPVILATFQKMYAQNLLKNLSKLLYVTHVEDEFIVDCYFEFELENKNKCQDTQPVIYNREGFNIATWKIMMSEKAKNISLSCLRRIHLNMTSNDRNFFHQK